MMHTSSELYKGRLLYLSSFCHFFDITSFFKALGVKFLHFSERGSGWCSGLDVGSWTGRSMVRGSARQNLEIMLGIMMLLLPGQLTEQNLVSVLCSAG